MAAAGPNSGGTFADDATVGTIAWLNPGNAAASDDVRATNALLTSSVGHYLKATNFGFAIPSTATINGIQVDVERSTALAVAGTAMDNSVRLVKGGVISGDDKPDLVDAWPGIESYNSYGSSSDLWGLSWAPADINASDFGVVISAYEVGDGAVTIRVDHIRITVTYTTVSNRKRVTMMSMTGFGR